MKKIILSAAVFLFAFQMKEAKEELVLSVGLNPQQWNAVITIMDMSTAPHSDVKIATNWLLTQLNDSLKQKKK